MTLETKKTIAMVGSVLAVMATISGIILMGMQIPSHGGGFFVGYLFYALAILAGGMFITWIPRMVNHNYGLKMKEGHLRWEKNTNVADERRLRLVFIPFATLFFELYGIFDYCDTIWPGKNFSLPATAFAVLTVTTFLAWALTTIRKRKKTTV